ncbi:MAG: zinc-binding alcohol dehydrogenase [Chloroflexota bacterium]
MQAYAVIAPEKGKIDIDSQELPPVGPGQVLIESHISTISPGTELAFLHHMPNTPGNYPMGFGYSSCGTILEVGEEVEELSVGQRVVSRAPHATHVLMDAKLCFPVPDSISDVDASVYRLGSIALQGVRKAQIQLGWSVAVLGLGPIGNLAAQISRATGAAQVVGIDPVEWRRDLAMSCGLDAVTNSAEMLMDAPDYEGFEAVIEATGAPQVVPSSFHLAKWRGHVVLLASSRGETNNVNFYRDVHKKGLTIFGAHESTRAASEDLFYLATDRTDSLTVLKLLATKRIQTAPLVSDIVSFEEADTAYERLANREEPLMTIALRWK